jgi:cytochrome P450
MALSEANFYRHNDFLPDRFLPDGVRPTEFSGDKRSCLKPFGLGGRNCLGKSVALAEMRIVLTKLVWTFELSATSGGLVNWKELKNYIVVQKEPIHIVVGLRKGS